MRKVVLWSLSNLPGPDIPGFDAALLASGCRSSPVSSLGAECCAASKVSLDMELKIWMNEAYTSHDEAAYEVV